MRETTKFPYIDFSIRLLAIFYYRIIYSLFDLYLFYIYSLFASRSTDLEGEDNVERKPMETQSDIMRMREKIRVAKIRSM